MMSFIYIVAGVWWLWITSDKQPPPKVHEQIVFALFVVLFWIWVIFYRIG